MPLGLAAPVMGNPDVTWFHIYWAMRIYILYFVLFFPRFVFHQAMSTKLDNRVLFPIDDMDVGDYMNVTDSDEDLIYDLQSAVNHYGGELFVNSGSICDDVVILS